MGASASGWTERLRGLPSRAVDRWREAAWRIALATVTAAVAWVLAQLILRQPAPIFAPIAAVVCLTDSAGVRGQRAVRLLAGVCVGVGVGELAKIVVGSGWAQVAASLAAGMFVVAAGSINSLTLLQSGIASLIVVGTSSSQAGWTRLASAIIGGVLALIVSQVLFSPSPVRTFARAAGSALRPVADGLDEVTVALLERSPGRARRAAESLRAGHADLAGFLDTASTADTIAATTLRGRHERTRVRELRTRFEGIEYVYAGSVLLARAAAEVVGDDDGHEEAGGVAEGRAGGGADAARDAVPEGRRVPLELVDAVADLAAVVRAVADDPVAGDPPAGRDAGGDRRGAHEVADALAAADPDEHSAGAARLATAMHLVAVDVAALTVAGEPHPGRDRFSPAGSGSTGA